MTSNLLSRLTLTSCLLLPLALHSSGCRTTQRYVALSRPHTEKLPHRVERIDAAYATPDHQLLLRATGILAGEKQPREMTILLPLAPAGTPQQSAQRLVVTADTIRAGWTPPGDALRPIRVEAPLNFRSDESYDRDRLQASPETGERVHLVRRASNIASWEVLHVDPRRGTPFTVFETRSANVIVARPAYRLLIPFAAVKDVLDTSMAVTAPTVCTGVLFAGATGASAAGTALAFHPDWLLKNAAEGWNWEHVFGLTYPLPALWEYRDSVITPMFAPLRESLASTPPIPRSK
ncbi:MAG: hypothetical protein ACKODH_05730 [Limisphaerales bacterium]